MCDAGMPKGRNFMLKFFGKKGQGNGPSSEPRAQEETPDEKGFFKRLQVGLSKTRSSLTGNLDRLVLGKKEITGELLEDLEEILFTSDMGVETTQALLGSVKEKVARKELKDPEKIKTALKDLVLSYLWTPLPEKAGPGPGEPRTIMVVGVNGVGKTTTIGKAAHALKEEGKKVMLVAADTFRAAAVEQLGIWGERAGVQVVRQGTGADPSAVVFDGLAAALSRKMDVVLIDTAGRLHTSTNLMEELLKIHRVAGRKLPGAPHEIWLVLDATTGQNAIAQARICHDALGVTGIILTKLDGTAKGGIVVGISHQMGLPIKYIGIGEKIDDLRPFNPSDFANAIFT
jgi:fused signal recognition particle receptor